MEKSSNPPMLPESAIAYLTQAVPAKGFLKAIKQQPDLCNHLFQGFEVKAQSLTVAPIRQRLFRVLQENPDLRETALTLWQENGSGIHNEIRRRSVKVIEADLESLAREWGGPAIALALAVDSRKSVQVLLAREKKLIEKYPDIPVHEESREAVSPAPLPSPETAPQEFGKLKQQVESLSSRLREAEAMVSDLRGQARTLHAESERLRARAELSEAQVALFQKTLDKTRKALDRVERARDRAVDEAEKLTKEMTRLKARLASERAASIPAKEQPQEKQAIRPSIATRPGSASSEEAAEAGHTFHCQVDGMHYSLSLREMLSAIATNNEDQVKEFSRLLASLKRTDAEQYKKILTALRKEGQYYPRVLTERMTPAIVDGSNVAHCEKDHKGRAKLQTILNVREELRAEGFFPIWVYVDASLPHQIDNGPGLERLFQRGEVIRVPVGTSADDVITRHARDSGACVVTNDRRIAEVVDPTLHLDTIGFVVFNADVTLRPAV